jgi:AcrR family transcriptional regulator
MVSRRPEGRDQVVAALLKAAERLVAERGPAHVTLREVAGEADVNLGLVHRHIGSKDDLLQAVLERVVADGSARTATRSDWEDAVRPIFAPSPVLYDYAHLLAWLLLEGLDPSSLAERLPTSDALVGLAAEAFDTDDHDARVAVLALLSIAFGWHLFGPFLTAALGLDGGDPVALRDRLAEVAVRLPDITGASR